MPHVPCHLSHVPLLAPVPLQRYKLVISYRGTNYHGFQRQTVPPSWKLDAPAHGLGIATVQEALENAVAQVTLHRTVVVGSSRTDAGVHAKGQVVHFDTDKTQIPLEGFRRAINVRLPADIVVRSIEPVPDTFDSIKSTAQKRYQYAIWNAPDRPVFAGDLFFHRWQPIDVDAMRAAAAHWVGAHDFASFAKPGHGRETTVRTVHSIDVARRGPVIVIGVQGSGFLWNQVRIMAGTLVEVGQGIYTPDDALRMLQARDRKQAGKTAPPGGLYLQWIQFTDSPARVLRIRPLSENDSLDDLTALLHRAYAPLADRGMQFLASHQSVQTTRHRISTGTCYVGELDGKIVSTLTLYDRGQSEKCEYYTRPGVWHFGQFAVEPQLKGKGVGTDMLRHAELQAASGGASELALDTSDQADDLLRWYTHHGYLPVGTVTWNDVNYSSQVLSKSLRVRGNARP